MAAWYLADMRGVKQQAPEGLFQKGTGYRVRIVEQDGDAVRFVPVFPGFEAPEQIGDRADLVEFGELDLASALRATSNLGAGATYATNTKLNDARWGIRGGWGSKMVGTLVATSGSTFSYRFFKQGGSVPHFLPVSAEDAVALLNGQKVLKYTKGGSTARLVEV